MNEALRKWYHTWKSEFANHKYLILLSLGFFVLANIISFLASSYVDKIATTTANDLILDHIPTLDLDAIFGYGIIMVILVTAIYVVFFQMRRAHVVTLQFGLLIFVRSCFIVLTHLGRPASARAITDLPAIYNLFNFHNDLFFSAHTAIPFMAFLLFRKEKIGIFFLIMTVILAATVLLLHVHYSIDVFSAFFITFGTYKIGVLFCKKFYHYE